MGQRLTPHGGNVGDIATIPTRRPQAPAETSLVTAAKTVEVGFDEAGAEGLLTLGWMDG